MFVFRAVALLIASGVIALAAAWLFTGNPRYFVLAKRLLRFALVVALVFFGLLVAERILLPIL
ncbi:hypothetical protein [Niveibacterium terrae]|uniref:hypothetical protein n=1 Tax=Niveibacterium terrae TaxID=3373598 RepID=UPI003A9225A7